MLIDNGSKYYYKDNKGLEWEFREKMDLQIIIILPSLQVNVQVIE